MKIQLNSPEISGESPEYVEIPFDVVYDVARQENAHAVALVLELALYSRQHGGKNPIEFSEIESFVPDRKLNRVLRLLIQSEAIEGIEK
jgi:hypothetical protein